MRPRILRSENLSCWCVVLSVSVVCCCSLLLIWPPGVVPLSLPTARCPLIRGSTSWSCWQKKWNCGWRISCNSRMYHRSLTHTHTHTHTHTCKHTHAYPHTCTQRIVWLVTTWNLIFQMKHTLLVSCINNIVKCFWKPKYQMKFLCLMLLWSMSTDLQRSHIKVCHKKTTYVMKSS